ncbi:MAG: RnfABCDGE type electron transport complex subunit D [Proteobacteria bacterium]|nr:RnfABCDGE type electron transport complex subunit D [Pseudomonadota bacterium]
MNHVLLALIPGLLAHTYFFGLGTLFNLLLCIIGALGAEALSAGWTKQHWRQSLSDHGALVSAVILALCLPPTAPWWLVLVSSAAAIVVGKQIFGGGGNNLFNPAMIGLVFALVAWPFEMSLWFVPEPAGAWPGYAWSLELVQHKFLPGADFTGITSATPLALMRTGLHNMQTVGEIYQHTLFGFWGGYAWEWINLGYLAGGLWLLRRRIIDWRAPVAMFASLTLVATLAYGIDSDTYAPPFFHLLSGGVMLGAFFVVTDPSTSCTTPIGKLIFGAGAGLLVFIVRVAGDFPDAVAFSVLLMNCCVPLLDRYLIPLCFAQKK